MAIFMTSEVIWYYPGYNMWCKWSKVDKFKQKFKLVLALNYRKNGLLYIFVSFSFKLKRNEKWLTFLAWFLFTENVIFHSIHLKIDLKCKRNSSYNKIYFGVWFNFRYIPQMPFLHYYMF